MSKYRNRITYVDNIRFDSAAEAARYRELKLLLIAGHIRDLELQPKFELVPAFTTPDGKKERAVIYRADFRYYDCGENKVIVEDVKGKSTQAYAIKRKLLLWRYPNVNFYEVRA